jgi:hypothetical protein
MFIAVTIVNALIFRARSQRHIAKDPSLEEGYRKLFWGLLIWGNLPWVIMGLGCLVGGIPSVFHYFRPPDGNTFILAFFASIFLIWILGTYWLFVRGGAEMLIRHPELFNSDFQSPAMLKLFWCLCLAGGIVAVTSMLVPGFLLPEIGP